MWDWELMKNESPEYRYEIVSQYKHEDFQYAHAISYGTEKDEFCLHNHAMYEIVYFLRGDVFYQAEGVRYQMEPGGLLIIGPAVLHKLFVCSSAPFERYTLFINYFDRTSPLSSLIARCLRPVDGQPLGSSYYGPREAANLRDLFARMSQAAGSPDEAVQGLTLYFAEALVAEMLMTVCAREPERYSGFTSKTIDALLVFLSQNFTRDISLDDVAARFFLSKDHCNRLFRQATGMTVTQYILYNRVLFSRHLLAEGVSAAEAGKQAGFADYSNFYRAYRKVTGRTPSADSQLMQREHNPAR